MLIDTHAHLDFKHFNNDREEVIKRALEGGVVKIINVGTNLESSKKSIALAEEFENIYAAVSLHPTEVEKEEFDSDIWLKLAQHEKVVAIGETGLDFYHSSDKNKQRDVFQKLIEVAVKVGKPLILHSREQRFAGEADGKILEIISKSKLPQKKGVVHCFSKGYEVAEKYLNLGFLVSFTGNITYSNSHLSSIAKIPLDKIMVETDCPFLAPLPFRGKRNEPLYVKYVAEKIAEVKGVSFERVAEATRENTKKLFNI